MGRPKNISKVKQRCVELRALYDYYRDLGFCFDDALGFASSRLSVSVTTAKSMIYGYGYYRRSKGDEACGERICVR